MKAFLILLGCILFSFSGKCQYSISFTASQIEAARKNKEIELIMVAYTIKVDSAAKNMFVQVKPNLEKSSLSPDSYKVFSDRYPVSNLKKYPDSNLVFIQLNADSIVDRKRNIQLDLQVTINDSILPITKNEGENKSLIISIKAIEKPDTILKSFRYLAYLGTNFDLVDGLKPKNLFFASNIFLPPSFEEGDDKRKAGVYLSLYGNRTMSLTDSSGIVKRETRVFSVNDTTVRRYFDQQELIRTKVSDNIGAYISPLFTLGRISKNKSLRLYYSPSLEFVWRRTETKSEYANSTSRDSIDERGSMIGSLDRSNEIISRRNEFAFNVGVIGLTLVHENSNISMRVHCSTGYSSTYSPGGSKVGNEEEEYYKSRHDIFFSGRAWITEPKTGITIQAEITNGLRYSKPYYGVTLSKAFYLDKLAGFFSPLTGR